MINNAADLLQRSQPHHLWQYIEETMTRIRFVLNRARSTPAQLGHFEVLTQEDLENLRAMDVQDDEGRRRGSAARTQRWQGRWWRCTVECIVQRPR